VTYGRALLVWAALFAVAFANGAFRELVLRRRMGELAAHQLSVVTGITAFGFAIAAAGRLWPFASAGQAWRTGLLWAALTIAWEFVFGHYIMRHSWESLLADYHIWKGRLWPLVLLWVAVAPRLLMPTPGR
jgi:hypothetical protein